MKETVMLVCPDCHCETFHVLESGEVLCSACGCEIFIEGEPEELPPLH